MPSLCRFLRKVSCQLPLVFFLQSALFCFGQHEFTGSGFYQLQNQLPHRTITGTVSNAVSGEPIRRALVQLWAQRQMSVLTGPDGRFQIHDVPEGPINLTAQKPGFFDSRSIQGNGFPQSNIEFAVGSGKNDFRLFLHPAARIVGHVKDRDGEPVENTQVQLLAVQILQGRKQWQMRNNAATEDDGSYRFDDLLPGRYIVFANGHAEPAQSWNGPREVAVPAYYPDAPDLASAQPVDVRPGQELRADFHLRTERGYRVTALVGGVPGSFPTGLVLENASGQSVALGGVNFDHSRGLFTAEAVPSGVWTLAFSANDGQGHQYEARQEINVNHADVTGVQVLLHPATSIPIIVNHPANSTANTEPAQGQNVPNAGLAAGLISAEPFRFQQFYAQWQADPPALTITNVPTGKYKLDVQPWGNECVESAWYGSVDLLRDYLVVGADTTTQPITISLRADCATLSAQVRAGDHLEQMASLLVVPSSGFAEPKVMQVQTQASVQPGLGGGYGGGGAMLTLAPGSYEVYALSSLDGLEYANPEALRGYPSQSVSLTAGQKTDLTLDLTERREN